ncbi:hypothetical protein PLESTB_000913400 [Pleodorina starrii]|uniref:UDENN domain-containing protein n=1 Tax=Pleodorina starrii TaxID=330485 RepID=A0A9W6BME8_9CHLO|nr:hypothetical protein PLESTM_001524400 [Pleodorina starrii]GLC54857.1 hypothetical protein PLESTB_000913400 [Pleodorina starrii]GLC73694.1 hypothetical protein PLESTF_001409100 [Pleodorina starrii]
MYLLFFVSRLRVESRIKTPVIYLRYKAASDGCENVAFSEQLLNYFCFPLGPEAVQPKEVQASEEYTFTLTHGDGQRFTGFCRQFFPPAPRVGSKARYPQVLCIVAENPWCNFFFKVLQVAEQLLKGFDGLLDSAHQDLPLESHLGAFIVDLRKQLATNPAPGEVLRLTVPNIHGLSGVSPPRYMGVSSTGEALNWGNDCIELQVPPDCGNGKANSGISLARLLFHVPVDGMLTLVASLLLERRIVFVARSRDTVTAAVQAAQALIYPFKWHHICLPLLPRDLVDYLSAPMPFLVGLTSEMLPLIRHIPMSEVTMVDLDLQKVSPAPGSYADDGRALPYGRQLGAALEAVFKTVRSPTEYESSPLITGVMQEYFVRLFGSYRRFIHEQGSEPLQRALPSALGLTWPHTARGGGGGGGGRESGRGYKEGREGRGAGGHNGGSDNTLSPQAPPSSSRLHDDMLRGHGYYFDQPAFVAHRRSETVRSFLMAMRHSQLYEMFIQERLEMAASGAIELPCSSGSNGNSYSFTGAARARRALSKSSSATNLPTLEKSSQGSAQGSMHASDMTYLREPGVGAGGGSRADGSGVGAAACLYNPFELRVERYPERRRLLREHMRSLMSDAAAVGGGIGGGGKLASKLRRHRRTDSEDLITQPPLHGGESMRRITTYPGLVDVSTPSLDDPFSYFAEWDLHEDDGGASGSPSPILHDREHKHSESGNSLLSMDSTDVAGLSGAVPTAAAAGAASFPFAARPERGGRERVRDRDRERERDSEAEATPLRRLSVSMLSTNAKSTYMSLRGQPSSDSPGPGERTAGVAAAAAAGTLVVAPAGGAGPRMIHNIFHANGGGGVGGGSNPAVAATTLKDGVQIKTMGDGHRVYDGSIKDFLRLGVADVKNSVADVKNTVISGLAGLASPLGSPRSKERESAAERHNRAQLQKNRQLLTAFAAAAPPVPQPQPNASRPAPQPQLQPQHGPSLLLEAGQEPPPVSQGSIPLPGMGPSQGEGVVGGRASGGGAAASGGGPSASSLAAPAPASEDSAAISATATAAVTGSRPEANQQRGGGASAGSHHLASLMTGLRDFKEKVAGAGAEIKEKVAGAGAEIKEKVAGAGAKAKALGILPTHGYKPQNTGEKTAKWKAQLAGGGGTNLVAGADGKLKQPHAPQRPLGFAGGLSAFMGRSDMSEPGPGHAAMSIAPTPMASPVGLGPTSEVGGPSQVLPFGPLLYPRSASAAGMLHVAGAQSGPGSGGGGGDWTPPMSGTLPAPGSAWRDSGSHVLPSAWDPFETGSAPPAAAAANSTWDVRGVASVSTSPFAASAHVAHPAGSTAAPAGSGGCAVPTAATASSAAGAGSSSCDVTTADLLGLSPSALSGVSSSFACPTGSAVTFDPFAASDSAAQGRLESAGSNDFAAFASASSPREFPGINLGAAPVVG